MADWPESKPSNQFENNFDGLVSIEENLDDCFHNVYEQLPVISFSEERGEPQHRTYIGKLEGHDENQG